MCNTSSTNYRWRNTQVNIKESNYQNPEARIFHYLKVNYSYSLESRIHSCTNKPETVQMVQSQDLNFWIWRELRWIPWDLDPKPVDSERCTLALCTIKICAISCRVLRLVVRVGRRAMRISLSELVLCDISRKHVSCCFVRMLYCSSRSPSGKLPVCNVCHFLLFTVLCICVFNLEL